MSTLRKLSSLRGRGRGHTSYGNFGSLQLKCHLRRDFLLLRLLEGSCCFSSFSFSVISIHIVDMGTAGSVTQWCDCPGHSRHTRLLAPFPSTKGTLLPWEICALKGEYTTTVNPLSKTWGPLQVPPTCLYLFLLLFWSCPCWQSSAWGCGCSWGGRCGACTSAGHW